MHKHLAWLEKIVVKDEVFKLFCLFLATDFAFICLYLLHIYTPFLSNINHSLETDRGYSEIVQYIKEYWAALLLVSLGARSRSPLYIIWSLLFFYLLLDDAAGIHEQVGLFLSNRLALPAVLGLRSVDLGEMIVSLSVGLFFFVAIAISYRAGNHSAREMSKSLITLLFILVFFGIVVDMIHIAIPIPVLDPLLVLLEDGGELVIMSCIICFIFSFSLQTKEKPIKQPQLTKV